jgi:hypothetical protein
MYRQILDHAIQRKTSMPTLVTDVPLPAFIQSPPGTDECFLEAAQIPRNVVSQQVALTAIQLALEKY